MSSQLIFLTGFGAFESVERNPSGELALALAANPPSGAAIEGVELPVTFRGAPAAMDAALKALAPRRPDRILSLGVHPGTSFRLETLARAQMATGRPDNDGVVGEDLDLPAGPDLRTTADLADIGAFLAAAGARDVEISTDAGGYVCERVFRHGLESGIPALFLHVPAVAVMAVEDQLLVLRALVRKLIAG